MPVYILAKVIYNLVRKTIMANPNIWAPGEALNANSSIRFESFIASSSQSLFTLNDFQYSLGTGSLMVFVSGIAQRPGTDFYETSVSSFTLSTPVTAGTIVLAMGMVEVSAVLDQTTGMVETYEAAGGETLLFIAGFSYTPGSDRLQIFRNGLLQQLVEDYTETSSNSITLIDSLSIGEKITFMIN